MAHQQQQQQPRAGAPASSSDTSVPDISDHNKAFHFLYDQAQKAHFAGNHAKANDITNWLLLEPECPPLCEAGAHLILAHAPDTADMQVDHARRALQLYHAVETQTVRDGPRRKYINWALARAQRILSETLQRSRVSEEQKKNSMPVTEAEYATMCAEYVDGFWEQELGRAEDNTTQ
ncbi:uncharacterized protein B0I36DRAFT_366409 [Microdochium trichocladiopsis]|uniref:Uncharacterized protein n=1 Tax=Microdochium trichocladiopsis TaxID=1682393 RepID=A0A9P8XWE4_9PEZI|nr:uncharacterized protein B0I36DRAFT_366409 [Microdochium trichocladiopsis]KAH7024464.1 hypothetical protein B0I36DRAFT_366409 [Microdochium trichocladiopsis]